MTNKETIKLGICYKRHVLLNNSRWEHNIYIYLFIFHILKIKTDTRPMAYRHSLDLAPYDCANNIPSP